MTRQLSALLVFGLLTVDVLTQQVALPQFEVASIKRRNEPLFRITAPQGARPGGSFGYFNTTLVRLVMYAFDLPDYRVLGGPAWASADRFDVEARAGREASVAEIRLMLRSLLQDRFKLLVRNQTREMPVYALVLDRPDGRLGPGLKRTDPGCQQEVQRPAQMPPGAMSSTGCGEILDLVGGASFQMHAPVVDKTGLTGTFAWSMYSAPSIGMSLLERSNSGPRDGASVDLDLPAYTTALREQLGLRLDATKGIVNVVVIDSAQPPSDN
jgi:uncharacterized protein (TIGR03435 family)